MVTSPMFLIVLIIQISLNLVDSSSLKLNTSSGHYEGKQVIVNQVRITQFFGIPYAEKPRRFEKPTMKKYPGDKLQNATKRTAGCLQAPGGLSYGPFELSDFYQEDCLTLNIFLPSEKSSKSRAVMVFCHGGSNQVGSASLFDGSAVAAIGDVIVITINYRLNILGFLTPGPDKMSGNYGLHDQILALKWISVNAKTLNADEKRITYVGHSAGAANALLLAMSKRSENLIARVIAQSGCPLNQWAIDRQPEIRFNNVVKHHGLKTKKNNFQSNLEHLKNISAGQFRYMYHSGLEISPDYPFPIVDNDILNDDLTALIRNGPLTNVDILVGVTADEALYFAEEHIFHHYIPDKYRNNQHLTTTSRPINDSSTGKRSIDIDPPQGFFFFKKTDYIKNYIKTNYPDHLCYYEQIRQRYVPKPENQLNVTETARLYTNLVSDLMFYYDLARFLHERLKSKTTAKTFAYYYTNPPIFDLDNLLRRVPNMIGHFAELDLSWGIPYFSMLKNHSNIAYTMNISYTDEEVELSYQIIRYWTNFVKTGDPNEPNHVNVHWPQYEMNRKSFINFHATNTKIEENFLEERFQFWESILSQQHCTPFRWYHTCLLIGILILICLLIVVYIFCDSKGSHANVKPTEIVIDDHLTAYHVLPQVTT